MYICKTSIICTSMHIEIEYLHSFILIGISPTMKNEKTCCVEFSFVYSFLKALSFVICLHSRFKDIVYGVYSLDADRDRG